MPRLQMLLSVALIALAGCTAQEAPRKAELVQAQPGYTDLGGLRVHYNLLPTLAMNDAVARSYGVERQPDRALLVVALRQLAAGDELPSTGTVQASATDLSGKRQTVQLRPVQTGAYTDLIGELDAHARDQLRIELQVASAIGTGNVQFKRNF